MKYLYWYFKAVIEFRQDFTTSHPDKYMFAYDKGRDFAHKITLRKFETGY